MNTFGNNLKELRKANHMSQKEFALRMNTTQQRVSEWECDKVEPSLYNVVKMMRIFAVSFEELTDGIDFEKYQ